MSTINASQNSSTNSDTSTHVQVEMQSRTDPVLSPKESCEDYQPSPRIEVSWSGAQSNNIKSKESEVVSNTLTKAESDTPKNHSFVFLPTPYSNKPSKDTWVKLVAAECGPGFCAFPW